MDKAQPGPEPRIASESLLRREHDSFVYVGGELQAAAMPSNFDIKLELDRRDEISWRNQFVGNRRPAFSFSVEPLNHCRETLRVQGADSHSGILSTEGLAAELVE
jgi:hypothetical protein